jgi:hypothetical protein
LHRVSFLPHRARLKVMCSGLWFLGFGQENCLG